VPPFLIRFYPDPSPSWGHDPRTFVAMMVIGFVIGVLGHLFRSRLVVAVGVTLIFLATFLLPLATDVLKS
jgi:hypothetical protein